MIDRARVDRAGVAGRVGDEHGEVDRPALERTALVELGERQQVVDEPGHPHGLLLGAAHRLVEPLAGRQATDAVQLGVAADRRDRRPQLVRRVGDEAAQAVLGRGLLLERLVELVEHVVERPAELTGLRRRRQLGHAVRPVAGGDLLGGGRHLLDRPDAEAHDPPRRPRRGRRR